MKFGSKLGSGGLKEVVTQHAEKAIFGVVLALVAFFIYSSATEETIPSTRSPDDLKVQAATASRHLGENFWDNIKVDRESKVKDFPERAKEARKPIDEAGYTLPNVLDKELIPKRSMRRDPAIMKPIQIEAEGSVLAVALRAGDKEVVALARNLQRDNTIAARQLDAAHAAGQPRRRAKCLDRETDRLAPCRDPNHVLLVAPEVRFAPLLIGRPTHPARTGQNHSSTWLSILASGPPRGMGMGRWHGWPSRASLTGLSKNSS